MSLTALAVIVAGAVFVAMGLTTVSQTAFVIAGAAIIVLVVLDIVGVAIPARRQAPPA